MPSRANKMPLAQLTKLCLMSLCLLIVALCSGCKDSTLIDDATPEQILLLGNGAEPSSLDPQVTTGVAEAFIHQALFEGLVRADSKTLAARPGVAESWEVSKDGRVWTFHLRKDAKWSNGEPVNAHDFVFSYERILTPQLTAEYASQLFLLEGAQAFYDGESDDFSTVGVKALDDYTLQLTLKNPTSYFLSLLNHPSWYPVPKQTILKYGTMAEPYTKWTRTGNHVSNGPFKLKEHKIGEVVIVERNKHYWNSNTVRLNEIHFHPIKNQSTEEYAFRAGQLHATYVVPSYRVPHYLKNEPELLRLDPDLGTYYYLINTARPPLDDVRVRQALGLVIDKKILAHNIRQRDEPLAHSFTPPGTGNTEPPYQPPLIFHRDIDKARQLLAEAGYPNGEGFPELELLYNTSEIHKPIAEALQQMWREQLGVDITLTNQEFKVYLETRSAKEFDIARAGWLGDYNDPNTFLAMWTSHSKYNHSGWNDERYDTLIAKAAAEPDPQARNAILAEAEELLMQQMPIIPIFHYNRAFLICPNVRNWHANVLGYRDYTQIYLDE